MKFITIALSLGAAAMVQAQASTLPACAQTCLGSFTSGSSIGGCSSLDIKCICSAQSFLSDIACCLEGACSAADQASAIKYAQQICETAGVTVPDSLSAAGSCSSSATSASGSSTSGSSSTTGTVAAASTTGSTTATSTSSSGTSHSSTSSGSATSSTASQTANAASENLGRPAGVFGAVAAALFLL